MKACLESPIWLEWRSGVGEREKRRQCHRRKVESEMIFFTIKPTFFHIHMHVKKVCCYYFLVEQLRL